MLLKCLEVGKNPLCFVSGIVIHAPFVLGDEDIFLQGLELTAWALLTSKEVQVFLQDKETVTGVTCNLL